MTTTTRRAGVDPPVPRPAPAAPATPGRGAARLPAGTPLVPAGSPSAPAGRAATDAAGREELASSQDTRPAGIHQGRMWTVALPVGTELLTANQRMHHMARAQTVKNLRETTGWLARAQQVPRIERAHIVAEYIAPDRRRRDPANWAPTAKAAVDGLVDAGVFADDDATRVVGPDMRLVLRPAGSGSGPAAAMLLHIYELAEDGDRT